MPNPKRDIELEEDKPKKVKKEETEKVQIVTPEQLVNYKLDLVLQKLEDLLTIAQDTEEA